MKLHNRFLLAAVAFTPAFSGALAGPLPATVNPRTVPRVSDETRRALVPPPITEPCRAELSVDRVEVSRSADGSSYNITATIKNSGTEAATGARTAAGGVLGLRLDVTSIYTGRSQIAFTQQIADIDVIDAGSSRSYGVSVSSRNIPRDSRDITLRIDRGPDGPRCAYDARSNNDGLGIDERTMRAWLDAGNASYVRVAPWAT